MDADRVETARLAAWVSNCNSIMIAAGMAFTMVIVMSRASRLLRHLSDYQRAILSNVLWIVGGVPALFYMGFLLWSELK